MKMLLATLVVLLPIAGQPCRALVLEPRSASFYCKVDFSGGVSFNEISKRWDSAQYVPVDRFNLKLQFISTDIRKNIRGDYEAVGNFRAKITKQQSHMPSSWFPGECETNIAVKLDDPWFSCSSGPSHYNINLGLHRFLSAYMAGYVDGSENNDAMPSVSAGLCTQLD